QAGQAEPAAGEALPAIREQAAETAAGLLTAAPEPGYSRAWAQGRTADPAGSGGRAGDGCLLRTYPLGYVPCAAGQRHAGRECRQQAVYFDTRLMHQSETHYITHPYLV
ncbi:hypothetical protein, partial [Paenibacillus illinoisensis]|uniref:hypothetical protein n=1 Tax=Paenibacillus illinoisensis TaxID=59845 RepID=UPI0015E8801D